MARRRSGKKMRRQKVSALEQLQELGRRAVFIGLALGLMGWVLGRSSVVILSAVSKGLLLVFWMPLCIGLGLLGVHFVARHLAARDQPTIEWPLSRQEPVLEAADAGRPATTHADNSWKATDAPSTPHRADHWSSDVFAAIEWRRFEAVVETLFAQAGFETRSQSHGADGGVDVWLHSKNAEGPVSVVQCKHWQGKPVGVKEVREFFGVMASHGLKRGTYATTSRFTPDALAFAQANGINAQDGDGLLKLISQRTPEQQTRLLDVAYEGEYWKPTCASCGVKMTERTSGKDCNRFWGCINFPRCKRTLVMRVT